MAATRLVSVLLFSGLALIAAPALAEAHLSPELAELLAQLDSPDPDTRLNATQTLMLDASLRDVDLARMYRAAGSLEQRARLVAVAEHIAIRRAIDVFLANTPLPDENPVEPGGVGVSHAPIQWRDPDTGQTQFGIQVTRTLPGFPGNALLQPGDIMTRFDGRPFTAEDNSNTFATLIQRFAAGDSVTLEILRRGQRLEIEVQLASFRGLSSAYAQVSLHPSYAIRRQKLIRVLENVGPASYRVLPSQ